MQLWPEEATETAPISTSMKCSFGTTNARCGGFVAAAMKRSQDDDEDAGDDGLLSGGPPSWSVRVDDVGGRGGGRKGKRERQTASVSCVAQKAISRRMAPTGGTCRRSSGALGGTPCCSRRVKQTETAKTRAMEVKARVQATTSSSAKVKANVSVLWSTQTKGRAGRDWVPCRRWCMEPDRSRVQGQDEVQCNWSSMPRGARGESSHQDHA